MLFTSLISTAYMQKSRSPNDCSIFTIEAKATESAPEWCLNEKIKSCQILFYSHKFINVNIKGSVFMASVMKTSFKRPIFNIYD